LVITTVMPSFDSTRDGMDSFALAINPLFSYQFVPPSMVQRKMGSACVSEGPSRLTLRGNYDSQVPAAGLARWTTTPCFTTHTLWNSAPHLLDHLFSVCCGDFSSRPFGTISLESGPDRTGGLSTDENRASHSSRIGLRVLRGISNENALGSLEIHPPRGRRATRYSCRIRCALLMIF